MHLRIWEFKIVNWPANNFTSRDKQVRKWALWCDDKEMIKQEAWHQIHLFTLFHIKRGPLAHRLTDQTTSVLECWTTNMNDERVKWISIKLSRSTLWFLCTSTVYEVLSSPASDNFSRKWYWNSDKYCICFACSAYSFIPKNTMRDKLPSGINHIKIESRVENTHLAMIWLHGTLCHRFNVRKM